MKLIDKDAVAVEVERRIKETESMQPKFDQFWAGQISAFKGVLKILDTLEVKECFGAVYAIAKLEGRNIFGVFLGCLVLGGVLFPMYLGKSLKLENYE